MFTLGSYQSSGAVKFHVQKICFINIHTFYQSQHNLYTHIITCNTTMTTHYSKYDVVKRAKRVITNQKLVP